MPTPCLSLQIFPDGKIEILRPLPATEAGSRVEEDDMFAKLNPAWLPFSPLEREILLLLAEKPATMRALAAATGRSADGHLKHILADLGSRQIITSGQEGYRLNLPDDRIPMLIEWLNATAG